MSKRRTDETLDPKDWGSMKKLAKKMAEDMIDYQETIEERPILKPKTEQIIEYFKQPAPEEPLGPEKTYEEFQEYFVQNKGSYIAHHVFGGV